MLKTYTPSLIAPKVFFIFILLSITSCETLDHYYKTQENLDLSVKAFNFEFESKAMDRSARFVHPDHRSNFLAKSLEMTKRVTFFEATVLDIKLFRNGAPATFTPKGPEKGIDRALIFIRYQLAVLPSTKLKTLIVEQEWVLIGEQWVVIPDLSKILE